MTIDEAINILKQYVDYDNPDVPDFYTMEEAIKVIIEALEQEPCEDVIDRAKAMTEIMMFAGNVKSDEEDIYIKVSDAVQLLRELPPVTPQSKTEKVIKMRDATPEERESTGKYIKSISKPTGVNFWNLEQEPKTGHWIRGEYWFIGEGMGEQHGYMYMCSECEHSVQGFYDTCGDRFCSKCGAKME